MKWIFDRIFENALNKIKPCTSIMSATVRDWHEREKHGEGEKRAYGLRYHRYLCAQPAPLPHLRGLAWMMLVMLVRACKQVSSYSHLFVAILSKQHEWRLWDDLISIPCLHHLASSFWHNMRTYILTSHRTRRNHAARWGFHCTSATLPTSLRPLTAFAAMHSAMSKQWKTESFRWNKHWIQQKDTKGVKRVQPPLLLLVGPHEAEHAAPAGFVLRSKTFLRSRDQ